MADSFRAAAATKTLASRAIEERFSHLTAGPPSPRRPPARAATEADARDERFRLACGAYVRGKTKAGARLTFDVAEAERLRADGARIDACDGDGWTALHWAAAEGHVPVVRYLVGAGADLDVRDDDGCTPLWAAAFNGEYQAALQLLARGPDLVPRGRGGGGAAMTASNAARSQRNPTIADVIDAEAELRRGDEGRQDRLRSGAVDYDAFRESLRKPGR